MSNSKKLKLYAPKEYWNAIDAKTDISSIINGCGTTDWKGELIPESLLGLSITPACNIHDWMYYYGETYQDKEEADRVFLNNMVRIINNDSDNVFLKKARLAEAKVYYEAVKNFGGHAFWENKNQTGTFREV
jgi:hypothetical protein